MPFPNLSYGGGPHPPTPSPRGEGEKKKCIIIIKSLPQSRRDLG